MGQKKLHVKARVLKTPFLQMLRRSKEKLHDCERFLLRVMRYNSSRSITPRRRLMGWVPGVLQVRHTTCKLCDEAFRYNTGGAG